MFFWSVLSLAIKASSWGVYGAACAGLITLLLKRNFWHYAICWRIFFFSTLFHFGSCSFLPTRIHDLLVPFEIFFLHWKITLNLYPCCFGGSCAGSRPWQRVDGLSGQPLPTLNIETDQTEQHFCNIEIETNETQAEINGTHPIDHSFSCI